MSCPIAIDKGDSSFWVSVPDFATAFQMAMIIGMRLRAYLKLSRRISHCVLKAAKQYGSHLRGKQGSQPRLCGRSLGAG